MIIKIKDVTVEVIQGDLVGTQADVYVCPINTKCNMYYGIASVLAQQGGEEFVAEIKAKSSPELGTVITTRAGNLNAKYVFFAFIEDEMHEVPREHVTSTIHHCFRLMSAMSLRTIAIPMLGSPRSKVPYDTFSRLMIRSTFEYFTGETAPTKEQLNIIFVLYNKELFNSFCEQVNILRQEFFI